MLTDAQARAARVPPIYAPGISEEVAAYAERIATQSLAISDYGSDWELLYRYVRAAMLRSPYVNSNNPTLDDESISAGIVRAIDAK